MLTFVRNIDEEKVAETPAAHLHGATTRKVERGRAMFQRQKSLRQRLKKKKLKRKRQFLPGHGTKKTDAAVIQVPRRFRKVLDLTSQLEQTPRKPWLNAKKRALKRLTALRLN